MHHDQRGLSFVKACRLFKTPRRAEGSAFPRAGTRALTSTLCSGAMRAIVVVTFFCFGCAPHARVAPAVALSTERAQKPAAAEQGPTDVSQCEWPGGKCKHPEIGAAALCYGTNPGPNAPWSMRACVCHQCMADTECGIGKRCVLSKPRCSAAVRICADSCVAGACPPEMICAEGACLAKPGPPPP
jgi:hypothetical protein